MFLPDTVSLTICNIKPLHAFEGMSVKAVGFPTVSLLESNSSRSLASVIFIQYSYVFCDKFIFLKSRFTVNFIRAARPSCTYRPKVEGTALRINENVVVLKDIHCRKLYLDLSLTFIVQYLLYFN